MKTYAESLRGFVGKKGYLTKTYDSWHFQIHASSQIAQLIDIGTDYAEFSMDAKQYFIPLDLLVVVFQP